jgi:hypothetical protein
LDRIQAVQSRLHATIEYFMRGSTWQLLIALALVLAVATAARAADTGTVSGAVFDQNGQPVADATVKISGDRLPVGRTLQTSVNGIYLFEYLLPGEYAVEVDKPGVGMARRAAIVGVGKDTQVDFVIGLSLNEALTVTAARPIVDVRSTEVSFNFTTDTLNVLPLDRTYRGLFQLIPGVADNRSAVGPAAGGNRQDNTYLIDGANITNPGFGYLGTEVNELDIAEVNLKRAGISAEFGRTSGTVTNAVSRSGSNRFSGIGRIDWLSEDLVSDYQLPDELLDAGVQPGTFRDPLLTTERDPAVGLGGPILPNRIFFYGSARHSRRTKWGRINKVATPLPDEIRAGLTEEADVGGALWCRLGANRWPHVHVGALRSDARRRRVESGRVSRRARDRSAGDRGGHRRATRTTRAAEARVLGRHVKAGRRLLEERACDRCQDAPATHASGKASAGVPAARSWS